MQLQRCNWRSRKGLSKSSNSPTAREGGAVTYAACCVASPASEEKSEARRALPRATSQAGAARGGLPRRDRHRLERVAATHGPVDAVVAGGRRPMAARESLRLLIRRQAVAGGRRRACGWATSWLALPSAEERNGGRSVRSGRQCALRACLVRRLFS